MTDISFQWKAETLPDSEQLVSFLELLQYVINEINPQDSLKEIRIISDNALVSEIQSLTGEIYRPGPHMPEGVAVSIEQGGNLSSVILLRHEIFTPGESMRLTWLSTLLEEIYHCKLYHQKWQRCGYVKRVNPNSIRLLRNLGDVKSGMLRA